MRNKITDKTNLFKDFLTYIIVGDDALLKKYKCTELMYENKYLNNFHDFYLYEESIQQFPTKIKKCYKTYIRTHSKSHHSANKLDKLIYDVSEDIKKSIIVTFRAEKKNFTYFCKRHFIGYLYLFGTGRNDNKPLKGELTIHRGNFFHLSIETLLQEIINCKRNDSISPLEYIIASNQILLDFYEIKKENWVNYLYEYWIADFIAYVKCHDHYEYKYIYTHFNTLYTNLTNNAHLLFTWLLLFYLCTYSPEYMLLFDEICSLSNDTFFMSKIKNEQIPYSKADLSRIYGSMIVTQKLKNLEKHKPHNFDDLVCDIEKRINDSNNKNKIIILQGAEHTYKTTLASSIFNNTEANYTARIIFARTARYTIKEYVISLIHQYVNCCKSFLTEFKKLYSNTTVKFPQDLIRLFCQTIKLLQRTERKPFYIILDGIDENPDSSSFIIEELSKYLVQNGSINLKVVCFTRFCADYPATISLNDTEFDYFFSNKKNYYFARIQNTDTNFATYYDNVKKFLKNYPANDVSNILSLLVAVTSLVIKDNYMKFQINDIIKVSEYMNLDSDFDYNENFWRDLYYKLNNISENDIDLNNSLYILEDRATYEWFLSDYAYEYKTTPQSGYNYLFITAHTLQYKFFIDYNSVNSSLLSLDIIGLYNDNLLSDHTCMSIAKIVRYDLMFLLAKADYYRLNSNYAMALTYIDYLYEVCSPNNSFYFTILLTELDLNFDAHDSYVQDQLIKKLNAWLTNNSIKCVSTKECIHYAQNLSWYYRLKKDYAKAEEIMTDMLKEKFPSPRLLTNDFAEEYIHSVYILSSTLYSERKYEKCLKKCNELLEYTNSESDKLQVALIYKLIGCCMTKLFIKKNSCSLRYYNQILEKFYTAEKIYIAENKELTTYMATLQFNMLYTQFEYYKLNTATNTFFAEDCRREVKKIEEIYEKNPYTINQSSIIDIELARAEISLCSDNINLFLSQIKNITESITDLSKHTSIDEQTARNKVARLLSFYNLKYNDTFKL